MYQSMLVLNCHLFSLKLFWLMIFLPPLFD
nr:MAG TPA: hypothetical protein [Crassvirales sp.]